MKKIIFIILSLFIFFCIDIHAEEKTNIYLFYREDCPRCHEEIEYLNTSDLKNYNLILLSVEEKENRKLYEKVQDLLNKPSNGVPYLLIGGRSIVGFDKNITPTIINEVLSKDNTCDVVDSINNNEKMIKCDNSNISNYSIPLLGNINPRNISLTLIAIIMGFVDGFNPCAMWILIFLISLLIGIKDKKKVVILGSLFLISSAISYLLFMKSWISLSKFLNTIKYLKIFIGLFAVLFGFMNIKNYFKSRKSDTGCEVVDDKKRFKIISKIKSLVKEKNYFILIMGIIALAMVVNVIELTCSLGLPVIFSEILSLNNLNGVKENMYVLIYIFFYMLDDLVIFLIAVFTFKVSAISNKYTKYSHLIGGLLLFLIGILIIFKPSWLMFEF